MTQNNNHGPVTSGIQRNYNWNGDRRQYSTEIRHAIQLRKFRRRICKMPSRVDIREHVYTEAEEDLDALCNVLSNDFGVKVHRLQSNAVDFTAK